MRVPSQSIRSVPKRAHMITNVVGLAALPLKPAFVPTTKITVAVFVVTVVMRDDFHANDALA